MNALRLERGRRCSTPEVQVVLPNTAIAGCTRPLPGRIVAIDAAVDLFDRRVAGGIAEDTPHVGGRLVATELITDSWLIKAPPKLRRQFEAQ